MSSVPSEMQHDTSDDDESVDDNVTLASLLTNTDNAPKKISKSNGVSSVASSCSGMVTRSHNNKGIFNDSSNDNEPNGHEADDTSDSLKPKAARRTLFTSTEETNEMPLKKRKENSHYECEYCKKQMISRSFFSLDLTSLFRLSLQLCHSRVIVFICPLILLWLHIHLQ